MCHSTHLDASEIAGPLILLQVWAWERLPFLTPRRETDIPWDNLCPLGARRSRTDVPGPSVSYGRVDADVRPSDMYIPSPAHMSPPPYMASSSSMYHQLMPDFAQQSSEIFNYPIPQVPYFQYGNTPASYDPGMGSGVQAEEGFSGADEIPPSDDLGDRADVPPRRNPTRRRRPCPCGTGGHFL
ncbi:hypothetical protein O6P43_006186 [Quillaja saponaria]|uniref:Aminotransferase-like plant mobile domain-containing protein n=1 Tax=Quillaja saponaria TaxID=32244 RepID=A0AAD7VHT5_QUISA|nr:hypothetical protein O6P43_006186 [Quillaja saponaria]